MKGLMTKFDRLMAAVTFAEEGEHETARLIMAEGEKQEKTQTTCPNCGESFGADTMPRPHKA